MQESLGHKLRLMRAERGLSLREAARRAGVVKETISDIERGKTHPYDVTLAKLAQAYEVPIERLLEAPPTAETTPAPEEPLDSREGAPQIDREAFVERGVEPSSAELATLNELLKVYTELARTGEEKGRITIPEGPVDLERVYLLVDFALTSGIFAPEDVAVLRDGVRAKLAAGSR
jgi:transcriptional regulator with XRE-family HTH domain